MVAPYSVFFVLFLVERQFVFGSNEVLVKQFIIHIRIYVAKKYIHASGFAAGWGLRSGEAGGERGNADSNRV
ncbi:MAG TPA: hypothetical protein PLW99_00545, partial [Candidatus Paceibacterota bacterium]|nr:hypothetical protein [Candidatus Paceibacterota bacterium]